MQKKFVLKKKAIVETEKGETETLTYTPSDFDEKEMSIIFKDAETAKQLGLPTETINDSVIVEFGVKEKQSQLVINEKEDEKIEEDDADKNTELDVSGEEGK